MGSGTTCWVARLHERTGPAPALKPDDVVAVAAAAVAVAGDQDEDSSEQPRAEAVEPRPWPVGYRHAVKIHVESMCAVVANARVARQALQSRGLSVRSSQFPLTFSGAG